jgi:formylglycine-generating enzyme required for sulfatase activity
VGAEYTPTDAGGAAGATNMPNGGVGNAGGVGDAGGAGNAGGVENGGGLENGGAAGAPEQVCEPKSATCDADTILVCRDDGSGFDPEGTKCSTTQTCKFGACVNHVCEPDTTACSGKSVLLCASDGLSTSEQDKCSEGEYCDVETASCQPGVCAPDEPSCDGTRATTCNALGSGFLGGGQVCTGSTTCKAGVCQPHVCTPNALTCDAQSIRTCAADGLSWTTAPCDTSTTFCSEGAGTAKCQAHVCKPSKGSCSGNTVRTCNATGSDYASETACETTNKTCVDGACVGVCAPTQRTCNNQQPQKCDATGAFVDDGAACSANTAYNGCSAGACVTRSLSVTGGSFYRDYNAATATGTSYPATVSSFKLDQYEITVGQFRRFVTAVAGGYRPSAGAGKHVHLNGGKGLANVGAGGGFETGWDTSWNSRLYSTKAAWDSGLNCYSGPTWTSGPGGNENKAINCISWYQAFAYCIWDGGFLPSEAEWQYAAGSAQQRYYPWSSPASSTTINATYATYATSLMANVGSTPAGNGPFGHSDLAGNAGEWTVDFYDTYITPCTDCTNLATAPNVARRGGSYGNTATDVRTFSRAAYGGREYIDLYVGGRCARAP